jgi:Leucine-rich repeat (LRR) protein
LTAPKPVSPNNEATGVSLQPSFEWEAVEGADYYILHANRLDPSEMVVENEVEGTTFTPGSNLDTETKHDWRVRAVRGDTKGAWSEIHRFTTGTGGDDSDNNTTVTLVSPSDGAGSQSTSPSLDWESVSGINEYQVQLATDNSFSSPVVNETVSQTSYDVSSLDYSQTYYWRVEARGDGDSGNWSSVYSFTTKAESNDDNNNGDYANSVEGDRQALMDLYEATGGSGWSNDSGWGSGNPDNSWYGVEVDGSGRLVRLDLSGNNLSGSLPKSIGNLSKLKYFNVKQNRMGGSIPESIVGMVSLTHLLLNGRDYDMSPTGNYHPGKPGGGTGASERTNEFSGQIPTTIGQLSNLKYIEITGKGAEDIKDGSGYPNALTGAIPSEIGNLKNLIGLHLGFNSLESVPNSIGNLENLVHLGLLRNKLAGTGFPTEIGELTKLQNIWLARNNFGGEIPDISSLRDLRIFIVTGNDLEGEIPGYLVDGTMPEINLVNLAWNSLSGPLPEFGTPNNLKAFQVDGNNLTGTIPNSISNIPRMINFSLGWNELEGEIPDLSHMGQLRYIRANNNNFTGAPPMVDTTNDKLNFLHFQSNNMTERVPTGLADIAGLPRIGSGDLNVSGNNFSDSDLEPLIHELESDGSLNILNY